MATLYFKAQQQGRCHSQRPLPGGSCRSPGVCVYIYIVSSRLVLEYKVRPFLQNFLSGQRFLGYGGVACSKKYSTHGGALPKEAALPAPALGRWCEGEELFVSFLIFLRKCL